MADTLYNRHRPTTLDQMVGQPEAVARVRGYLENGGVPNALIIHGVTGTGKTTLAHVLARGLGAKSLQDLADINCGVVDPLDTVRAVAGMTGQQPAQGKARVWIFEEVQALSRAPTAQNGLLRVLEKAPGHNYFFLLTTDPSKVIKPLRGRCTRIELKPIPAEALKGLVKSVAAKEGAPVGDAVAAKVAGMADGSARDALVLLEQVLHVKGEREQLACLGRADPGRVAFDLVKCLMPFKGQPSWKEVAEVLESVKEESPERIRQLLLSAARTTLLKGGPLATRAAAVIDEFRDPFYGETGADHAILAATCFSLCQGK